MASLSIRSPSRLISSPNFDTRPHKAGVLLRLVPRGINGLLLILPLVTLVAIAGMTYLSIVALGRAVQTQGEARARAMAEAAVSEITMFEKRAADGTLTLTAAQTAARDAVRSIRFDNGNYVHVLDQDGNSLAHPKLEGTDVLGLRDSDGVAIVRGQIAAARSGPGFSYFRFPKPGSPEPVRKAAYNILTKGWGWVVSSGVYLDDVELAQHTQLWRVAPFVGVLTALSVGAALLVGRESPVVSLGRGGEIGRMAEAVEVLQQRSTRSGRLPQRDLRCPAWSRICGAPKMTVRHGSKPHDTAGRQ